jgi:hypothetical protein
MKPIGSSEGRGIFILRALSEVRAWRDAFYKRTTRAELRAAETKAQALALAAADAAEAAAAVLAAAAVDAGQCFTLLIMRHLCSEVCCAY